MCNILIYFLLYFNFKGVFLSDPCEEHNTCRKCIQDTNSCVWCAFDNYNGTRCKNANSDISWCPDSDNYLQNPKNFIVAATNSNFSSDAGTITQIRPQRYQMTLRPGQPQNFSFSFKAAKDYPVDLYFLFDASRSMAEVTNHTAENSEKIYETMITMTNDVFMGMGSFVDKNTLPYTLNVTKNLAYSFRHHLKLTKDHQNFQTAVKKIPVGENRDLPEGGLDALAQSIVCKKDIGWRKESTKIIILLTNDIYHAAGDGRSAGIFKPYDGNCYTENGVYTKELEMDYPTVSTINKLAKQNDIVIIFVVKQEVEHVYSTLAESISGSKVVTLDVKQKDGIVTTLKNIYEEVTKNIELKVKSPKNYDVSFDPDCTRPKGAKANSICDVRKEEEYSFNGTIKLREYVGNDDATIDIAIVGINEKLTLDIKVLDECNCSSTEKDTYCNGEKRECGVCVCGEGKYGSNCACSQTKPNTMSDASSTCYAPGNATESECSGRGECKCGICDCDTANTGYQGRYCECLVIACPHNNLGQLCSNNGTCLCNRTCKCNEGWTGDACECSLSNDNCQYNGAVCNNRGKCDCNSCICDQRAPWDIRSKEDSLCVLSPPDRPEDQCTKLNDCVLCHLNNNTNCDCPFMKHELMYELPEDIENSTDWSFCRKLRVDVGCYTNYTYMYNVNQSIIDVKLQTKRECAAIYYLYGAILLLTLLLVGIFTLVGWKLCMDYRDRKEYLDFVKDHEEDISGPCENPLYEPAITTFRNPAFRKRSVNH